MAANALQNAKNGLNMEPMKSAVQIIKLVLVLVSSSFLTSINAENSHKSNAMPNVMKQLKNGNVFIADAAFLQMSTPMKYEN